MSRNRPKVPPVESSRWNNHLDYRSSETDWKNLSFVAARMREDADLCSHVFDGSDFEGMDFQKAKIRGASFRNCSLRGCDLSKVSGATDIQFAGADLEGAVLPESVGEFKQLGNIEELSKNAGKISASMLLVTTFTILTVLQSKDSDFFAIAGDTKLPLLDTTVPIRVFYSVTPFLLTVIYLYLHLHLQRLWEALSKLPAVFPSGRRIDETVYPWLQNELVVRDLPRLEGRRPPLSRLHHFLYSFLAWWLVPVALIHIWSRFLTRHDSGITDWHIVLTLTTFSAAVYLRSLASKTLLCEPKAGRLRTLCQKVERWLSRLFDSVGVKPNPLYFFAGLYVVGFLGILWLVIRLGNLKRPPVQIVGAELSKPSSSGAWNTPLSSVVPVRLERADLKGAYIASSFLAGAELDDVRLNGANIKRCDLRGVTSQRGRAVGTKFEQSDLSSSVIRGTLALAEFKKCDLRNASIQMPPIVDPELLYLRDPAMRLFSESNADGMKDVDLQVGLLEHSTMRGITGTIQSAAIDSLVASGINDWKKNSSIQNEGETKLHVRALKNSLIEKVQVYVGGEKQTVVTIERCVFISCSIQSGLTLNSGPKLKFVNCCFKDCTIEAGLTSPVFENCFQEDSSAQAADSKVTPNDKTVKVEKEISDRCKEFDRMASEIVGAAGLTDRDPAKKS